LEPLAERIVKKKRLLNIKSGSLWKKTNVMLKTTAMEESMME
jgi:hypothetical protein